VKKIRYFWQFLIPIILYFPYLFINKNLLVNWFGCGCPKIDENGIMLTNQFNANDFSKIFWLFIALVLIILSILISLKFQDKKRRVLYTFFSVIVSILLSFVCFSATPLWK